MNNSFKVQILSDELKGRLFIGGDLHGMYGLLIKKLTELGFDFLKDTFVCTGDLVDRGGLNEECVNLLDEPWFKSVRGNHEQILIGGMFNDISRQLHMDNGGEWFYQLPESRKVEIANKLDSLPYAIELNYKGMKIGVVHANVPGSDWEKFKKSLTNPSIFNFRDKQLEGYILWNRDRVDLSVKSEPIKGVDAIFLGHNIMQSPCRRDNFYFIDTGAFATLDLTIIEVGRFFNLSD